MFCKKVPTYRKLTKYLGIPIWFWKQFNFGPTKNEEVPNSAHFIVCTLHYFLYLPVLNFCTSICLSIYILVNK